MAFLSIPGLGYRPDPKAATGLSFDRNQCLRFVAGTHCDNELGWANAHMRMRIVDTQNCTTYFDSRSTSRNLNPFHYKVDGNKVTHNVLLQRTDIPRGMPEGWLNVLLEFGGEMKVLRLFNAPCACISDL